MRKFIVILVLFLGIAFVTLSFGELKTIIGTLKRWNVWFLFLALAIQTAWFVVAGLTYRSLYNTLNLDETTYRLTLMSAAANFINVVAPSAGMGGIAVFISDANQRGQSVGKVTVIGALYVLFDYIAFLFVLALGLIVLIRRNDLGLSDIIASSIMLAIAGGLGFLLYLGSQSADALGRALAWMARIVNRVARPFIHREYLKEERAFAYAHEMADGLKSLPSRPRSLITPMLYSFANKALMISVLLVAFLSFDVPFSAGTIIGGFAISYLFLVVSPTPSGIGVVEGIMAISLSSLGVQWSEAVIITLAYRAITFWVPLGAGAWALRVLHFEESAPESPV